MTIQVKHVRSGVLVVADAGLRFGPGQVLEVETLTPQLERAISAGLLVQHERAGETSTDVELTADTAPTAELQSDETLETGESAESTADTGPTDERQTAETSEVDLSKLRAAEAISEVETEDDPDRLKAHLAGEDRRTVIAALEKQLAEVEADDR